jgi:hypothetical protein
LTTVPLPPPVCPFGTFFFLVSSPAATRLNTGLRACLSEPAAPVERPVLCQFPSPLPRFLRHNRTTPILVRMSKARKSRGLGDARRAPGLKERRSGETSWDRTVRFVRVLGTSVAQVIGQRSWSAPSTATRDRWSPTRSWTTRCRTPDMCRRSTWLPADAGDDQRARCQALRRGGRVRVASRR